MADEKMLSKFNIGGELYNIKDAEARIRLTQTEDDIDALESGKQNVIDASNKLAAAYVSFASLSLNVLSEFIFSSHNNSNYEYHYK